MALLRDSEAMFRLMPKRSQLRFRTSSCRSARTTWSPVAVHACVGGALVGVVEQRDLEVKVLQRQILADSVVLGR